MKKITLLLIMFFVWTAFSNAQNITKFNAKTPVTAIRKSSSVKTIHQLKANHTRYSFARKTSKSAEFNYRINPGHNTGTLTTSSCDTLIPSSFSGYCLDSLTIYVMDAVAPYDSGYATGQNIYHFGELAQKFTTSSNDTITDVFVMYAVRTGATGNTYVKIYSVDASGNPGTLLGTSSTIVKNAIDTSSFGINFNNDYHFSTPVITSGKFFVSIAIPTTFTYPSDELGIWDANISCSAADSAAYVYYGSTWYSFITAFGANIDMAIFPGICSAPAIPIADFTASNTSIYTGTCISFADHSTNFPTSWNWTFNGATPGTSTLQNPSGICYPAAGNYSVTLIATNSLGSDTITKTSYISVTVNTNPPVANFTASATNVTPGTTVNFTDLSTNSPTSWLWAITPSSGWVYASSTTATSQNPMITFNTIGSYTIALTATNSYGNNTYTIPNYIYVSNTPHPAACDTIIPNAFSGYCLDSLSLYIMDTATPYDSGYATGQNIYHFGELAQKFTTSSNDTITDVFVMYAVRTGATGNTYVKIYSVDASGNPGTLLGTSSTIVKNAIDTSNFGVNFNNDYHFSSPVITLGKFFVSVVIPTTFTYPSDELGIWDANISCSTGDSAAYVYYGSTWYSFIIAFGANIDMAIFPASCSSASSCSAQFNMYPDTTTQHHYYAVNMVSGTPPLSYYWSWGDGTHDTIPYPSHTYSATGFYNICLTIADSVGCTNTFCDSTNIQKSGNSAITIDVIPQGSAGIQENSYDNSIILFPDPATDNLTIIIPEKAIIEILNIEGQIIKNISSNGNHTTIDISDLARGMYFVKVKIENVIAVRKFIKE